MADKEKNNYMNPIRDNDKKDNDKKDNFSEKAFLEKYDINQYDRPSLAADIAVFSIGRKQTAESDYRKLPPKRLRLLLIKRAGQPFYGKWALPGGFMQKGETIQQTARRELKEETGTDKAYLELCQVFSDIGRDPRGWIISQAFIALLNEEDIQKECFAAGGDAGEAAWFDMTVERVSGQKQGQGSRITCDNDYVLMLEKSGTVAENEPAVLKAAVREHIAYRDYHEIVTHDVISSEGIAFDHARIIVSLFNHLRRRLESDVRIAFDFMPEYFTLTDLQEAVELISGKELIKPNFRRKITEYVIETDKMVQNGGHRPSKAFVRNLDRFYE